MHIGQGGIGESAEVDFSGTAKVFAGRFADGAGELYTAYSADAPGLEGDGAGNGRIG